jgi:hypothetical protein
VEDRQALGERDRQVEEERALPGLLDGLGPQLALALGGGVRLGCQQQLIDVSGFPAGIRAPTELGAVGSLAITEQQVIRLALDPLAILESQCCRARAPPAARWFSSVSLAWM